MMRFFARLVTTLRARPSEARTKVLNDVAHGWRERPPCRIRHDPLDVGLVDVTPRHSDACMVRVFHVPRSHPDMDRSVGFRNRTVLPKIIDSNSPLTHSRGAARS
jgi:hypothetical protein